MERSCELCELLVSGKGNQLNITKKSNVDVIISTLSLDPTKKHMKKMEVFKFSSPNTKKFTPKEI